MGFASDHEGEAEEAVLSTVPCARIAGLVVQHAVGFGLKNLVRADLLPRRERGRAGVVRSEAARSVLVDDTISYDQRKHLKFAKAAELVTVNAKVRHTVIIKVEIEIKIDVLVDGRVNDLGLCTRRSESGDGSSNGGVGQQALGELWGEMLPWFRQGVLSPLAPRI